MKERRDFTKADELLLDLYLASFEHMPDDNVDEELRLINVDPRKEPSWCPKVLDSLTAELATFEVASVPTEGHTAEPSWLGRVLKPLSEWVCGQGLPIPVSGPAGSENELVKEWSLQVGSPDDMKPAELHLVVRTTESGADAFVEVRAADPGARYMVRAFSDGEHLFEEELKGNERACVTNADKLGPDTQIEVIELK
jgi:hypothetical protein